MLPSYKVVLVGDAWVGKTSLLDKMRNGHYSDIHPTKGVDVQTLSISTNYGELTLKIWDCAGFNKGLEDCYYVGADAAICMFDVSSRKPNIKKYARDVKCTAPGAKIVYWGNKVDKIRVDDYVDLGVKYHRISVKCGYNIERPWLDLARRVTGFNDLVFI